MRGVLYTAASVALGILLCVAALSIWSGIKSHKTEAKVDQIVAPVTPPVPAAVINPAPATQPTATIAIVDPKIVALEAQVAELTKLLKTDKQQPVSVTVPPPVVTVVIDAETVKKVLDVADRERDARRAESRPPTLHSSYIDLNARPAAVPAPTTRSSQVREGARQGNEN